MSDLPSSTQLVSFRVEVRPQAYLSPEPSVDAFLGCPRRVCPNKLSLAGDRSEALAKAKCETRISLTARPGFVQRPPNTPPGQPEGGVALGTGAVPGAVWALGADPQAQSELWGGLAAALV